MTKFKINLSEGCEADSSNKTTCGVFIPLPYNLAKDFPDKKEDDSVPHFTVLIAGDLSPYDYKKFVSVVRKTCRKLKPFTADLSHYSEFLNKEGQSISHMSPSLLPSLTLAKLHGLLRREIEASGLKLSHNYGKSKKSSIPYELQFKPHATLAYKKHKLLPYCGPKPTGSWRVTDIECWGYERYQIPLGCTSYNQPIGLTKEPRDYKYPSAVTESNDKREQVIGLQKLKQLSRHDQALARVRAATTTKEKIDKLRQVVRTLRARKQQTGPQTTKQAPQSEDQVDESYDHDEFMQKLDALRQRAVARDPSLRRPPGHEPNRPQQLKRAKLLIRIVKSPLVIKARRKIKITGVSPKKKINEAETSLKGIERHPTAFGGGPSLATIGLSGTLKYLKMLQDEDRRRRTDSSNA